MQTCADMCRRVLPHVGVCLIICWHMLACLPCVLGICWHVLACLPCVQHMVACGNMCQHMLPPPSMCRWWCKLHAATYANTCRYVFGHHTPTHMHTHKHTHCQSLFTDQSPNAVFEVWKNTAILLHMLHSTHAALFDHVCYNILLFYSALSTLRETW